MLSLLSQTVCDFLDMVIIFGLGDGLDVRGEEGRAEDALHAEADGVVVVFVFEHPLVEVAVTAAVFSAEDAFHGGVGLGVGELPPEKSGPGEGLGIAARVFYDALYHPYNFNTCRADLQAG